MQTQLRLLHTWDQQLWAVLPSVRVTRVAVLAAFSLGILWAGSVTLSKVAGSLPLAASDPSRERRLRRWLARRAPHDRLATGPPGALAADP